MMCFFIENALYFIFLFATKQMIGLYKYTNSHCYQSSHSFFGFSSILALEEAFLAR